MMQSTPAVLAASCPTGVQDRRRSPRESKDLPAWLSPAAGSRSEAGYNVVVVDLSVHGVGFKLNKPLVIGQTHWMVVAGASLRLSTRLQVVSCRPHPDGGYVCGGEFF